MPAVKHPLHASGFASTFATWGTFDHQRLHSNAWHNPTIKPPAGYDYSALTDGLHPDQDAYRMWLIDIMAYLLFDQNTKGETVRFLELGSADAIEVSLFLTKYGSLWDEKVKKNLEIHLLDDDCNLLFEAFSRLETFKFKQINLFFWKGKLEDIHFSQNNYELRHILSSDTNLLSQFPPHFDLIYSQLVLHHYALISLIDIFQHLYNRLCNYGHFLFSDICYTGIKFYDAMIWNRLLLQIEAMEDEKKRKFWSDHYRADYPTYHSRKEIESALQLAGFHDISLVQCAYDMATIVAAKPAT